MTQKPDWWPENPYPASVFPIAEERYPEIVPDPELRTALSGMLGRQFWNIASEAIWEALCRAEEEDAPSAEMVKLIAVVSSLLSALHALHYLVSEVANPGAFDNGVYAPDGRCEGDFLAGSVIEQARTAIVGAGRLAHFAQRRQTDERCKAV